MTTGPGIARELLNMAQPHRKVCVGGLRPCIQLSLVETPEHHYGSLLSTEPRIAPGYHQGPASPFPAPTNPHTGTPGSRSIGRLGEDAGQFSPSCLLCFLGPGLCLYGGRNEGAGCWRLQGASRQLGTDKSISHFPAHGDMRYAACWEGPPRPLSCHLAGQECGQFA